MDATRYKPMAGALKAGARKRLQLSDANGSQGDPTAFAVRTDDLSRVQHDLQSPTVQIKAERRGDACVAAALMTLGPSNGHATIKIESVITRIEPITLLKKMRAMVDPDSIQIYAVTVKGTDIATSQPISAHIFAPTPPEEPELQENQDAESKSSSDVCCIPQAVIVSACSSPV